MLTNEGTPDPRSWICSIVCNRLDIKSLRFGSRGRSGAVRNEVILADIKRLRVWLGPAKMSISCYYISDPNWARGDAASERPRSFFQHSCVWSLTQCIQFPGSDVPASSSAAHILSSLPTPCQQIEMNIASRAVLFRSKL